MLGLKLPTDPRWADLASKDMEEILTDHAYCEQKAATQCITLIQLYSGKEELVNRLAPIVSEEWSHFRMVLDKLHELGLKLGPQRKDRYVQGLLENEIKGGSQQERLLDKLLICALIEARSCERFKMLSEELEEESMKKFYYDLMVSEAGHYRLFIDLAKEYCPEDMVRARWDRWLKVEGEVIAGLEVRGDRVH
jgi:tRNA-(ms[2]io[6]A)-hydroxylase